MFGAEWAGDEPSLELMPELPIIPQRSGSRASLAHDLLVKYHPEFNRHPRKLLRHSFGSFEFTGQEWMAAVMAVKKQNEQKIPGVRRFFEARERIIQLAEAGLLITAVREKAGGDPFLIPRHWWNSERISNRFDLCQMNYYDPYGVGSAGDWYQWIFVTRESLTACTSDASPPGEQQSVAADPVSAAAPLRSEHQVKPRGRKPGQGSYDMLDAPLLLEMRQLLSDGKAASAEEAARQVASRAHGGGTPESKAERLARRFRKEEAQ
jgi:hypothetical protein